MQNSTRDLLTKVLVALKSDVPYIPTRNEVANEKLIKEIQSHLATVGQSYTVLDVSHADFREQGFDTANMNHVVMELLAAEVTKYCQNNSVLPDAIDFVGDNCNLEPCDPEIIETPFNEDDQQPVLYTQEQIDGAKKLPEEVIQAYHKYCFKQDEVNEFYIPDHEKQAAQKKIDKAYNKFAKVCEEYGLDHVKVSAILLPPTPGLSFRVNDKQDELRKGAEEFHLGQIHDLRKKK